MTRASWPTLAHAFRRAALPLSWYYIVTLVLPLANGAAQSGGVFASHAVVVLVVPPIVIMCACAIQKMRTCLRSGRACRLTGSSANE
jgi:hypothetical protein